MSNFEIRQLTDCRMPDKLLTVQEAANLLGVSAKTLRRWDKAGILVPLRTVGKQRRYLKKKTEEFKQSNKSLANKGQAPREEKRLVYDVPPALRIKKPTNLDKPRGKEVKRNKAEIVEASENLLTVQNAAYILGVSTKTLRRWDKGRILVPLRTAGGQRRYLRKQVEALQRLNSASSSKAQQTTPYPSFQTRNYLPQVPGLESPIRVDRSIKKMPRLNKLQIGILLSSLSIFMMLGFITVAVKINFVIPDLIGNLDSRFRGNDRGGENDRKILVKQQKIVQELAVASEKGIVLGETTTKDGLFFNVNVPSTFNGSSEFIKGLSALQIATLSAGLTTQNQNIDAGTGELTAANVLYGVVAGSGITVTGDTQNPTITNTIELAAGSGIGISGTKISNTGVLSLGDKTGDVKLSAGTGITVSGVTITNAGVTSLTGTANQVIVSGSTGSVTLSLPQSIGTSSTPVFSGLTLSSFTSNGGPLYTNGSGVLAQITAGSGTQCLLGGTTPTFGSCGAGETLDIFWNQSSGALFANNSTVDLLIGGQSTSSAKFAFLNTNSGTPTASVSAGSGNNAITLAGTGVLGTTNAQTLTLGNSATGHIALAPAGSTAVTVASGGNVGVGTSTPLGALHVVGQCVTGDTRLRRRRRKSNLKTQNSKLEEDYIWEEIRIDEIQIGDEILTLDEATGEFVPQRVEKLMDMGIKDIIKITTASGKTIRTTANHPYLANITEKDENEPTNSFYHQTFESVLQTARAFYHDVLEGKYLKVKALGDKKIYFSRDGWNHLYTGRVSKLEIMSRFFALLKVIPILKLAKIAAFEKSRLEKGTAFWALQGIVERVWAKVIIRETKYKQKHFYSVIWKGEDHAKEVQNAIKKGTVSRLYPRFQAWSKSLTFSTFLWEKYSTFIKNLSSKEIENKKITAIECLHAVNANLSHILPAVKKQKWVKIKDLKEGAIIATADGWEKVVKIKKLPAERVYDIQVENTHNFVGGHYVNKKTNKALSQKDEEILSKLLAGELFNILAESNIHKKEDNNQESAENIASINKLVELFKSHNPLLSRIIARNKMTIARSIFKVKSKNELAKTGAAKTNPAAKLVKNPAYILNAEDEKIIAFINQILSEQNVSFKTEDLIWIEYGGIVAHNTYIMSGNVGVGTTSPLATLDVRANSGTLPVASVSGATSFATLVLDNSGVGDIFTASSSGLNRFVITQGGNVGIGDTSPDYLLELLDVTNTPVFALSDDDVAHGVTTVAETDVFARLSTISTTVGGAYLQGLADASGVALQLRGIQSADPTDTVPAISLIAAKASGTGVVDLAAAETVFQVANNDNVAALTVRGDGSVGIGTATPTNFLTLNIDSYGADSGALTIIRAADNTDVGITIDGGSSNRRSLNFTGIGAAGDWSIQTDGTSDDDELSIVSGGINGTTRMSILSSSGNVGIGNTAPLTALDVTGSASLSANLSLRGAGTAHTFNILQNGTLNFQRSPGGDAGVTNVMYLGNNGNVGLGTASPLETLDVRGSATVSGNLVLAGAARTIQTTANNLLTIGGNTTGNITISPQDGGTNGILNLNTTNLQIAGTAGSTFVTASCVTTIDGIVTGSGSCGVSSNWTLDATNGVLRPNNSTVDLLIGGISSSAANFRVTGNAALAGTTSAASVSARTSFAGLVVDNTIGDLFTASSSGVTQFVIRNNGAVGIGAVSIPLAKLHVEGQCVTGDSILVTEDGKRIRVDEIKKGQKVYTLDQETQRFVPAQVNALLDMGVKPVFRLKTASGKEIRTTGNHPYLTNLKSQISNLKSIIYKSPIENAGWVKVSDLEIGDRIAVAKSDLAVADQLSFGTRGFSENKQGQKEGIKEQTQTNQGSHINFSNKTLKIVNSHFSNTSSILQAINNNTITKTTSTVNSTGILSSANITRANPAAKLTKNEETTLKNGFGNKLSTTNYFSTNKTSLQWDTIVAIDYVGEEQVYDLAIEGTHNFVANGIVAHNTYINGNLGVGTASPLGALDVRAQSGTTPVASVSGATSFAGLLVDNSGVGDIFTASSSGLNRFVITQNGNVGIADTTPDAILDIDSTRTTGGDFLITNTGVGTSGTVAGITANSLTSGDILTLNATSCTSCSLITLTGPSGATAGVTDAALKIKSDVRNIGTSTGLISSEATFDYGIAGTGTNLYLSGTDATSVANTDYNIYSTLALSGLAAKTGYGTYSTITSSSTTADTLYSIYAEQTVTGAISSGTRNQYGIYSAPANTALNTTGSTTNIYGAYLAPSATSGNGLNATNVYGAYITTTNTPSTTGTDFQYGLYIADGISSNFGNSTKYGLYVESQTGADTNYAAIFAGGAVGIGTTSPLATLDIRRNVTNGGTIAIASASGATSFAGLVVDNTGVGDLFTASRSGATKFTILNNGNLQFAGQTNFLTTLASAATAARTITFPDVTGTLCTSVANCSFDGLWNSSSGALYPGNSTLDLLIGGVSSASAYFRVTGNAALAGTTSVASVSARTSFAGLVVDNTIGDLFTASSSGVTQFVIRNNGAVGIGAVSIPLAKLHVEGQCVTGDSILVTEDGKRIRVDEIKKGQKVYTLNQQTGRFVPAQVNALLDMGVKPVFKLTTKSGKTIRTTGNHPYLVSLRGGVYQTVRPDVAIPRKEIASPLRGLAMTNKPIVESSPIEDAGWVKVSDLEVGDRIAVADNLLSSTSSLGGHKISNNNQSASNQKQRSSDLGTIEYLVKLFRIHSENRSNNIARIIQNIASPKDFVNEKKSSATNPGAINTTPNHPADKLPLTPESTRNSDLLTRTNLLDSRTNVNRFVWDTIVSIEYTGEEQVYDLAIEGTHNFVANGIVAHNTYINGNLGVGTASPLAALDVRGQSGTTPVASVSGVTSFAGLVLDNNGVGDIFTASKSGATKFVINNNGNLSFAGQTNFLTTLASAATANRTITFPDSTGTICLSTANCSFDGLWNTSSGALYPGNSTLDLLIGGVSSTSANFRVTGNAAFAGTTSAASISAKTSFAGLVVDNTIGDLFTASSSGLNRFVIRNSGNVGIGTAQPTEALDVLGNIQNLATTSASPTRLGALTLNSGENNAFSIAVSGRYAYVTTETSPARVVVIDISNPVVPTRMGVGVLNSGEDIGRSIAVSGRYAYVSTSTSPARVIIVDISNPTSPARIGGVTLNSGEDIGRSIAVSGRYAYVSTNTIPARVVVVDISNPSSPARIGAVTLNSGENLGRSIAVSGRYAYVITSGVPAIVVVIDVSNPSSPARIGAVTLNSGEDSGYSIAVSGRYAYVTTQTSPARVVAVDISNPSSPARIGAVTLNSGEDIGNSIAVSGRYAYVTTNTSPARVVAVDISNPSLPARAGGVTLNTGENEGQSIVVSGRYAYVATYTLPARVVSVDIHGIETTSMMAHSLEAGSLQVRESARINDQLFVAGGLGVGGGIHSNSFVSIFASHAGTLATLDVQTNSGTAPVASFSARSSFSTLVLDNSGVGDLFTASSSGVTQFVIRNNGGVGIGTAIPLAQLDVRGEATVSGGLTLAGAARSIQTTANNTLTIGGSSTGDIALLPRNGSGFVGVNTSSPAFDLDVVRNANSTVALRVYNANSGSSANSTLYFGNDSTGTVSYLQKNSSANTSLGGAYSLNIVNTESSPLTFFVGSNAASGERLRITSTGLIGVGTTLPVSELHVTRALSAIGGATGKALAIFDQIENQDIFTASSSGITRFTLSNSGDASMSGSLTLFDAARSIQTTANNTLTIGGNTTGNVVLSGRNGSNTGIIFSGYNTGTNGILYAANTTGVVNQVTTGSLSLCLLSGASSPTWGDCAAGASSNWDILNTGVIVPKITSRDFLLGGTSTSSASFRVTGDSPFAGTNSAASVSARTSFAALVVDNRGVGDLFTASSSGTTRFVVRQSGVVLIGNNTDGLTFDYLNGGPLYTGASRITKRITLSPEYAGAVLTASGSATTTGDMTSDASASATLANYMTYYEWTSSQTTLQDYTVVVRVTLPQDFSAWTTATAAAQIRYNTELPNVDTGRLDILIFNADSTLSTADQSTPVVYRQQNSTLSKNWTNIDILSTSLDSGAGRDIDAAGETMAIYLRMYSKDNTYVQVGDIVLNYLARF